MEVYGLLWAMSRMKPANEIGLARHLLNFFNLRLKRRTVRLLQSSASNRPL